jgi:hypothetical protein
LSEKARGLGKPVLSVGAMPPPVHDKADKAAEETPWEGFSVYPSPQRAARVLRHLLWYKRYLDLVR